MHCSACATRIQRSLGRLPPWRSASVNLATTRAFVAYDPARLESRTALPGRHRRRATPPQPVVARPVRLGRRAIPTIGGAGRFISWPLAIAALVVSRWPPRNRPAAGWTVLSWPSSWSSPAAGRSSGTAPGCSATAPPSMDTLIALGTLAALAVSAVEAIALGGRHVHLGGSGAFAARLHGVMAPLIVAILVTGRAVEARARSRAATAMHSLLSLRPPTARVVSGRRRRGWRAGRPRERPGRGPRPGPPAGEALPLDGTVVVGVVTRRRVDADRRAASGRPRSGRHR